MEDEPAPPEATASAALAHVEKPEAPDATSGEDGTKAKGMLSFKAGHSSLMLSRYAGTGLAP